MDKNEALIRAREAVIASGQFPGAEEMIRNGGGDHWGFLQAAYQACLTADKPLDELRSTKTIHVIYKDVSGGEFFVRRGLRNFWVSIKEIFTSSTAMERLEQRLGEGVQDNTKLLTSQADSSL